MTPKQNFMDTSTRPLVEDMQRLLVNARAVEAEWAVVLGDFANDATVFDDGRPDEGLAQFPESLVFAAMAQIASLRATLETIEADMPKIAVRPLRITG